MNKREETKTQMSEGRGHVLWIILRQLQKATRYQKAIGNAGLTFKMEELLDCGNDSPVIRT